MSEAAKKFMKISIWSAVILFILRCLLSWEDLSNAIDGKEYADCAYALFGYAGEAIGITALLMIAFDRWLWKWKPLNLVSGGMPILANEYHGTINYDWNGSQGIRETNLYISQTFLRVSVKLGTAESTSNSITGTIATVNDEKQLIYTYLNTPRAEIQNRSVIHFGTAMLKVDNPAILTGNYYTSRLSRGSMELKAVQQRDR